MIRPGDPARLGAQADAGGVNFALFSGAAVAVELCLFDATGRETARHALPAHDGGVWHGCLAGCAPGQRYGYRVHGEYAPERGLRFNPNKLLIDPYARALDGRFRWHRAVFDFDAADPAGGAPNTQDSAAFVPKCVVTGRSSPRGGARPGTRAGIPWSEAIVYEANVRGFTMRHPEVPERERGTFRGMRNGAILGHLKALGITHVELMPVHEFLDEAFLHERGLRNLWGYNSLNFFTPAARLANGDPAAEFREMVDAIHDAGLSVILDVAYNHTAESDEHGPTLSFRGIDNLAYYRTEPGEPGRYANVTGCGNALNTEHQRVRELVLDSLCYWHRDLGVDGFRFDLAATLARAGEGFDPGHAMLSEIGAHPSLAGATLVAEPWDAAPGGYSLGRYPNRWAEWNDRYRDTVRRFWRGDEGLAGEFARRVHGSADLFEAGGRGPAASVNFVTAHDGFTLADLVSYGHRHNEANLEANHDGHGENFSDNHGVEGGTDDPAVNALRRRQRLNLLATLLFSQGVPMLLAGDEFGHSQFGNNNAYCQDNEIGWPDWAGLERDPEFTAAVRALVRLRRALPLLRQSRYLHAPEDPDNGWREIEWLHPEGRRMDPSDWDAARAFVMVLNGGGTECLAVSFNAGEPAVEFHLPATLSPDGWDVSFRSDGSESDTRIACRTVTLPGRTLAFLQAKT